MSFSWHDSYSSVSADSVRTNAFRSQLTELGSLSEALWLKPIPNSQGHRRPVAPSPALEPTHLLICLEQLTSLTSTSLRNLWWHKGSPGGVVLGRWSGLSAEYPPQKEQPCPMHNRQPQRQYRRRCFLQTSRAGRCPAPGRKPPPLCWNLNCLVVFSCFPAACSFLRIKRTFSHHVAVKHTVHNYSSDRSSSGSVVADGFACSLPGELASEEVRIVHVFVSFRDLVELVALCVVSVLGTRSSLCMAQNLER